MPCYEPRQSHTDAQAERTAKAIVILCNKLNVPAPTKIKEIVGAYSFHGNECDQLTAYLCGAIRLMTPDQVEKIIYDAHDKDSRVLADWWDKHKEHDKKENKNDQRSTYQAK